VLKYSEIKILENTLLEYSRSRTVANFAQAIASRAATDTYLKSQAVDPVEAVVSAAEAADPTVNRQYVVWIIRQYTKHNLKYEDIYKLAADLAVFLKTRGQHRRLGVNSDINQYNWQSLARVADQLGSTELAEPTADAGSVEDAAVLYNGPLGILSVPQTETASCALGSGTRWCTAAQNRNQFSYYSKYGPLYVWHDKKRKQKYQFHFETGQFMDAQDQPLTAADAGYFMDENPVTAKLFKKNQFKLEELLDNLVNYVEREPEYDDDGSAYNRAPTELEELATEANFDFVLHPFSAKELVYYYNRAEDELKSAVKNTVMQDSQKRKEFDSEYIKDQPRVSVYSKETREARAAQALAQKFYRGPAAHLEDIIAQDGRSSYLYAFHSLDQKRFEKGEPEIAKDAWAATMYATKILKQRWPAAEPAIKKTAELWKEYQSKLGLTD